MRTGEAIFAFDGARVLGISIEGGVACTDKWMHEKGRRVRAHWRSHIASASARVIDISIE